MATFQGLVTGIDVIATPGQAVRCLAFVSRSPVDEIQVETEVHALQTALELASAKRTRVEISFEGNGPQKHLTRVRLLDRDASRTLAQSSGEATVDVPRNIGEKVFPDLGGALLWAVGDGGFAVAVAWRPL